MCHLPVHDVKIEFEAVAQPLDQARIHSNRVISRPSMDLFYVGDSSPAVADTKK